MIGAAPASSKKYDKAHISKYPNVSDVPMELFPFEKKIRLVRQVQRKNEKEFIKNQNIHAKMGFENKYKKELR